MVIQRVGWRRGGGGVEKRKEQRGGVTDVIAMCNGIGKSGRDGDNEINIIEMQITE